MKSQLTGFLSFSTQRQLHPSCPPPTVLETDLLQMLTSIKGRTRVKGKGGHQVTSCSQGCQVASPDGHTKDLIMWHSVIWQLCCCSWPRISLLCRSDWLGDYAAAKCTLFLMLSPPKFCFRLRDPKGMHCIVLKPEFVCNILATYGTFLRLGYLASSAEATLVIRYYDYHLMTQSFACFINFQHEKRELDIIWDKIYNIFVW